MHAVCIMLCDYTQDLGKIFQRFGFLELGQSNITGAAPKSLLAWHNLESLQ